MMKSLTCLSKLRGGNLCFVNLSFQFSNNNHHLFIAIKSLGSNIDCLQLLSLISAICTNVYVLLSSTIYALKRLKEDEKHQYRVDQLRNRPLRKFYYSEKNGLLLQTSPYNNILRTLCSMTRQSIEMN